MRGTRRESDNRYTKAPPTSSLRAQRSNPESLRGKTLDCFVALAMTWKEGGLPQHRLLSNTPPSRRVSDRAGQSRRSRFSSGR
ncbi:hypothetical protein EAS62_01745 [Bradyrhizobium zhanjiangense]|uniref:Uncharacterized protein n=1 Tax=Bradyrhizobium zhanjiangense TaxID=1325107 RepID=A0ABY0DW52_9BRAD|nr:hypothetical protein EAS62_01745 [Bradyrhizobium zhanjiangense]